MLVNWAQKASRGAFFTLVSDPQQNTIALIVDQQTGSGPMPGISIHVVDVSRGVVASGMRVELFAVSRDSSHRLITSGSISKTGVLADPVLNQRFEPGFYDARFHILPTRLRQAWRADLPAHVPFG